MEITKRIINIFLFLIPALYLSYYSYTTIKSNNEQIKVTGDITKVETISYTDGTAIEYVFHFRPDDYVNNMLEYRTDNRYEFFKYGT